MAEQTATIINELSIMTTKTEVESTSSQRSPAINTQTKEKDQEKISKLAALTLIEYDRIRKDEAACLGIRMETLDKLVEQSRENNKKEETVIFSKIEPWPEKIDPAQLLHDISLSIRRFIVCQQETADAAALWAAMTWFINVIQVAPLAIITAPDKRCGKTILLSILGMISCRPLSTSNISAAALFRSIAKWRPTLLIDEADSFAKNNDELRGIINCGHTRETAFVVRVSGDDLQPTRFNVWGAKAIALIGRLPDTLMDRSIVLKLQRKKPTENVERLRHYSKTKLLFSEISQKLARFAIDFADDISNASPIIPEELNDRQQDNWEPLLSIADLAGGAWPNLAREAALKLSGLGINDSQCIGTTLLTDIKVIFETTRADKISSASLVEALCSDTEKPWATYNKGNPVSQNQISKILSEYDIKSKTIRVGSSTPKGYELSSFEETFSRYLHPPSNRNTATIQ